MGEKKSNHQLARTPRPVCVRLRRRRQFWTSVYKGVFAQSVDAGIRCPQVTERGRCELLARDEHRLVLEASDNCCCCSVERVKKDEKKLFLWVDRILPLRKKTGVDLRI